MIDYEKFTDFRDAFENGEDVIGKSVRLVLRNARIDCVQLGSIFPKVSKTVQIGGYLFMAEDLGFNEPLENGVPSIIFKVADYAPKKYHTDIIGAVIKEV